MFYVLESVLNEVSNEIIRHHKEELTVGCGDDIGGKSRACGAAKFSTRAACLTRGRLQCSMCCLRTLTFPSPLRPSSGSAPSSLNFLKSTRSFSSKTSLPIYLPESWSLRLEAPPGEVCRELVFDPRLGTLSL